MIDFIWLLYGTVLIAFYWILNQCLRFRKLPRAARIGVLIVSAIVLGTVHRPPALAQPPLDSNLIQFCAADLQLAYQLIMRGSRLLIDVVADRATAMATATIAASSGLRRVGTAPDGSILYAKSEDAASSVNPPVVVMSGTGVVGSGGLSEIVDRFRPVVDHAIRAWAADGNVADSQTVAKGLEAMHKIGDAIKAVNNLHFDAGAAERARALREGEDIEAVRRRAREKSLARLNAAAARGDDTNSEDSLARGGGGGGGVKRHAMFHRDPRTGKLIRRRLGERRHHKPDPVSSEQNDTEPSV